MPAPDIASILEHFSQRTVSDRTALLQFARETPLVYGPWQEFKKLYKLAEEPALSGEEADVELLGVLLARLDVAPIPPADAPRLQPLDGTPKLHNAQTTKLGERTFAVGGRERYDSYGWRLETGLAKNAETSGGFFAAIKAALAPGEAGKKRVYDFNADNYINDDRKITAKNNELEIAVKNYRSTQTFRVDVSDPTFAFLKNSGPSPATWQYMKRRARRLLRKLATARPELYRALLHATLREIFALQNDAPLDPKTQWLSMDALFARSARWKQVPAARGPYVLVTPKFHFKTREERAPEIWDSDLGWTREMFCDETIPAAANAVALGVLRASKQEIPELSLTQLQRFLDSGIPLLQAHATRAVAARPDLEKQTPQLLAAALLLGNAGTRRKIRSVVEAALGAGSTPGAWRRTFAAQLARALEKGDSRRTRTAAQMLAHVFPSEVSDAVVFAHLQTFLEISGENQGWIFERIRKKGESGDLKFLDEIAALPQQFRECVLLEFSRSAAQSKPRAEDAMALVTKSNEAQNRIGWRFLAATNFESGQIQELWKTFSRRYYDEAIFAAAFGEPASAALWRRADWKPDEALLLVNSRGQVWQNFARYFCAEFFAAAIESLPTLKQLDYVFLFIGRTQNAVSEQIFTIFQDAVKTYVPSIAAIRTAFFYSYGWPPMPRSDSEALWKLVAQSQIAPETLRAVWRELWSVQAPATAFGDVAAKVLQRAQIPEADFAEWLPTAPIEKFAPVFFLTVLDLVAAEQKARLLLRPAEAQWQVLQNNVLELLKTAADLRTAFWSGAWQGLESAPDLLARFNHDFLATFNDVSLGAFSALLPSANSAHESLALNWLQTHTDELQRDENLETLIIAATHANDAIRLWGLRAVRERGLSVAVALRLMESGLPQPFALGREYFESAPRNSENERDYALALCDSPAREVQSYGREFLARRASSLLDAAMLQNLAEHPDGQMQSWVAELIKDFPTVQTAEFDTAILRARGKARRAKEKVKTRIGAQAGSTPDMQTGALLELARGSLARDREWALQQLAKRALNGEEIQGVTIK